MDVTDEIKRFYLEHLPGAKVEGGLLKAPCPFCPTDEGEEPGMMVAYLNPESFFAGYFRCLNRCIQGGFPLYFGRIMGIVTYYGAMSRASSADCPNYSPDSPSQGLLLRISYPVF